MLAYLIIALGVMLAYRLLSDLVSFVHCYRNDRALEAQIKAEQEAWLKLTEISD